MSIFEKSRAVNFMNKKIYLGLIELMMLRFYKNKNSVNFKTALTSAVFSIEMKKRGHKNEENIDVDRIRIINFYVGSMWWKAGGKWWRW